MSKQRYKIASQEGVERYNGELGDIVELDIKDEELAVIAAGWLEHVTVTEPAKEKK
jgi:hypothetical protein